jgi:hypothetical protein
MGNPVSWSIHHATNSATQLSRVAGGANVRPDSAGRAIAADQEEELMRREMGQLVETEQSDLGALLLVYRGVELQM